MSESSMTEKELYEKVVQGLKALIQMIEKYLGTQSVTQDFVAQFVATWNGLPGVSRVRGFSEKRKKALKSRLKDKWWCQNYREAMERIPQIPFLVGKGGKQWRANVDWFLRADVVTKILERRYDKLHELKSDTGDVIGDAAIARTRYKVAEEDPDEL